MADSKNPKRHSKQQSPFQTNTDELSVEQIDELFEAFTLFDKDYNGAISKKEIGVIMESTAQNAVDKELAQMIEEADTENNDLIDFPEFVSVLARKSIRIDANGTDELFKIFALNDEPHLIDSESLKSVLRECGETFSVEELDELISKARLSLSKTQGGKPALNFEDFKEIIQSIDINHMKQKITHAAKK